MEVVNFLSLFIAILSNARSTDDKLRCFSLNENRFEVISKLDLSQCALLKCFSFFFIWIVRETINLKPIKQRDS